MCKLPPAKRSTTKRRTTTRKKPTARKSPASKEPPAVARLNKALDSAQDALNTLRKDLSKGAGSSAKGLYKDLEKRVRDVRRDSGKFGKALQKDLENSRSSSPKRQAGPPRLERQAQAGVPFQGQAVHRKALHRQAPDGEEDVVPWHFAFSRHRIAQPLALRDRLALA